MTEPPEVHTELGNLACCRREAARRPWAGGLDCVDALHGPAFSRPVLATWNPAAWTRGSWWRVKCSPAAAELAVSGQAALSAEAPAEHTPPADEPCPLAAGGPCPRAAASGGPRR